LNVSAAGHYLTAKMKTEFRTTYGASDVLSIKHVEIPVPKENEVLIRVFATTVNRSDCHVLTGKPFAMRFFTGLLKPKRPVTGCDFAGQVEATGKDVRSFKVGDKVMGFGGGLGCGSHAEYFVLPESKMQKATVTIADNLNYEEAAACCEGAFYAAFGIQHLKPEAGQKAVVNGATGAIGSAHLQFLKFYGVHVTAVCRGEHAELMRSLGADRVIDYTVEDFTKDNEKYDFVFDSVGKSTFLKCKRLLKENGIFAPSHGFENIFWALVTPIFGGKKVLFLPPKGTKGVMSFIKDLVEKGKFKPLIDKTYSLDQIAEAYQYVMTGQKVGNVVISMNP
jgi:NADPH:quinone reductase-like Zn-dependent oxidoreductase